MALFRGVGGTYCNFKCQIRILQCFLHLMVVVRSSESLIYFFRKFWSSKIWKSRFPYNLAFEVWDLTKCYHIHIWFDFEVNFENIEYKIFEIFLEKNYFFMMQIFLFVGGVKYRIFKYGCNSGWKVRIWYLEVL